MTVLVLWSGPWRKKRLKETCKSNLFPGGILSASRLWGSAGLSVSPYHPGHHTRDLLCPHLEPLAEVVPPPEGTERLVVRVSPPPQQQGRGLLGPQMELTGPGGPSIPFVINAQAGQPGYRVPLKQLLQADHTLTRVFRQHIICKGGDRGERNMVSH